MAVVVLTSDVWKRKWKRVEFREEIPAPVRLLSNFSLVSKSRPGFQEKLSGLMWRTGQQAKRPPAGDCCVSFRQRPCSWKDASLADGTTGGDVSDGERCPFPAHAGFLVAKALFYRLVVFTYPGGASLVREMVPDALAG